MSEVSAGAGPSSGQKLASGGPASCASIPAFRFAASSGESVDRVPNSRGRSKGTAITGPPGHVPCRSGSPHGVRGDANAAAADEPGCLDGEVPCAVNDADDRAVSATTNPVAVFLRDPTQRMWFSPVLPAFSGGKFNGYKVLH